MQKKKEEPEKIILSFVVPKNFKKVDVLSDIAQEIARERHLNIETEIEREQT